MPSISSVLDELRSSIETREKEHLTKILDSLLAEALWHAAENAPSPYMLT